LADSAVNEQYQETPTCDLVREDVREVEADGLLKLVEAAGSRLAVRAPALGHGWYVAPYQLSDDADLRHVQIASRHADSRTTMRCDRARKNLDRHPDYISLTWAHIRQSCHESCSASSYDQSRQCWERRCSKW